MARYVVLDPSNVVQAVVEWDGVAQYDTPGMTKALVPDGNAPVRVGDTYVNGTVTPRADNPSEISAKNDAALRAKAINALAANVTFLAIASPTTAQVTAQVIALTKQVDAVIRVFLRVTDSMAGT